MRISPIVYDADWYQFKVAKSPSKYSWSKMVKRRSVAGGITNLGCLTAGLSGVGLVGATALTLFGVDVSNSVGDSLMGFTLSSLAMYGGGLASRVAIDGFSRNVWQLKGTSHDSWNILIGVSKDVKRLQTSLAKLPNGEALYEGAWDSLRNLGEALVEHSTKYNELSSQLKSVSREYRTEMLDQVRRQANEHLFCMQEIEAEIKKLADSAGELVILISVSPQALEAMKLSQEVASLQDIAALREYLDALRLGYSELAPIKKTYLADLGKLQLDR